MNLETTKNFIRLFGMSTLQIKSSISAIERDQKIQIASQANNTNNIKSYEKFDIAIRNNAKQMSEHYEVFHCLENSIRTIVTEVLSKKYGPDWWEKGVEPRIKTDVAERIRRDEDTGFTLRSENNLDFANFGELSSIIENQWDNFNDLFTSKSAMKKVMSSLNTLRGPIAHCCELAEDEIIRLELAIKDWHRLME